MPAATMTEFLESLYNSKLLDHAQIEELLRRPETPAGDLPGVHRFLQDRGWMTRFQIDEVVAGRGGSLVIANFRLLDRLEESPGGERFKVFHPSINKVVVLRIIRPDWLLPLDSADTYLERVRLASTVNHANLLNIIDAGTHNGMLYVVEDYADGTPLGYFVNEMGAMPAPLAIDYLRQAAYGLQAAHAKGVFHGDLHPDNLILSPVARTPIANGEPGHFHIRPMPGSVVQVRGIGCTPLRPPFDELTLRQSPLLKNIDFAPPEMVTTGKIDARSDIYSLGACIYFLLAARCPFRSANEVEAMWHLQFGRINPIEQFRTDLPLGLGELVGRMLARDPAHRPASLFEILVRLPGAAPTDSPRGAPSVPLARETLTVASDFARIVQEQNRAFPIGSATAAPKANPFGADAATAMPPFAPVIPAQPSSLPKPIFEPLPSDHQRGFPNATGAAAMPSPVPASRTEPSHQDSGNWFDPQDSHHGRDDRHFDQSMPPRKRAKPKKSGWFLWILIGAIFHITAILLLVGWFSGWFDSSSSSVPEPEKKDQKQDQPKKKKR